MKKQCLKYNQSHSSDNSFVDETDNIIDICNSVCEDYRFYYDVSDLLYEDAFKIVFTYMDNCNLKVAIKVSKHLLWISHTAAYNFIIRKLKEQIIDWFRT